MTPEIGKQLPLRKARGARASTCHLAAGGTVTAALDPAELLESTNTAKAVHGGSQRHAGFSHPLAFSPLAHPDQKPVGKGL